MAGGRLAFFVINIVSMVIPLGCLSFTRYVLGLTDPFADNISANVIGLGAGHAGPVLGHPPVHLPQPGPHRAARARAALTPPRS